MVQALKTTKVKNNGRIIGDGNYEAQSLTGVQSVVLQSGAGTGVDGLAVTLQGFDRVEGSLRDDTVTLLTVADAQHGAVSLGRGYDTLVLDGGEGPHTLKLDSVEMVKAAAGDAGDVTLKINGVGTFATDGSVNLNTANANDKSTQTITYTEMVDDTTLSLGGGQDKVIFKAGTLFRVDNGQLVATDGNGSVTFVGYASNATNLQIQVGNVTQTYKQWYKTADITPPVPSNFTATETTVGATSNERGTLGLYVADGTLLEGTARVRMVAKTPATVAVAAQDEVTYATLKVRDAPGNFALTSQSVVLGTTGNDTALAGTANADFMFGFDGNDSMTGGGGADKLYGGNGNDTFVGFVGADSISGGAGTDTLTLTATSADLNARADAAITGLEVVSAADAAAGVHINLSNQTDGFTIVGSGYNDTLVASAGVDTINSGAGNGDVLTFGAQGSLATQAAADTVTEYTLQTLDFAGNAALVGVGGTAVAGSGVQTSANGKVTFHANDDTLAEKIAVIQNDGRLDAANAVAIFSDGDDAYVYYAGTATGDADDQIVRLAGRSILDKIVVDVGGNITLDREPPSDPLVTASSLLPTETSWTGVGGAGALPTGFTPGNDGNSNTSQGDGVAGTTSNLIRANDGTFGARQLGTSPRDDYYSAVAVNTTLWSAGLNMFGKDYTQLYMGTNGYITFGSSFSGFSPQGIAGFTLAPMIAAQYDDLYINTLRNVTAGSGTGTSLGSTGMYYYAENNKMVFTWDNVSLYSNPSSSSSGNIGSAFQIILHKLDGENAASKNFGIEIRYEEVTQQSSGATAGWTAGDKLNYGLVNAPVGNTNTVLSTVAEQQSNVGTPGVWAWEVRDGAVVAPYYVPDIGISTAVNVASLDFRNNSGIESFAITGDGGGYGFTATKVSETAGNTKAMLSTIASPHWNLWKNDYMDGEANITITSRKTVNSVLTNISATTLAVDIVRNTANTANTPDPVTRTGAHSGSDVLTVTATSNDLNTAGDAELSGVATVTAATAVAGVAINLSNQSEGFAIIGSANSDMLLMGSSGNDTITGGVGADVLVGNAGNDVFIVASATDDGVGEQYIGGDGNDTLRVTGTAAINFSDNSLSSIETLDLTTDTGAQTVVVRADQAESIASLSGDTNDVIRLSDTTLSLARLKALENRTSALIDATNVTSTNGLAADAILLMVTNEGASGDKIDMASNVAVVVTDPSVAAADVNTIAGATTGVVTANLTGAAATLNTALTNGDANDALTITLDAGVAAATVLTALDGKTSVNVGAGAITGINGTAAEVKAVVDAVGITTALNYTSTVSDADADETVLNAILGDTTGIVTANLTGVAATLNTALTNGDANDALTITLDAGVAAATVLTALDGKTSVNVGAGAITGINGTAAEVKAVVDAVGITTALNYTSTVSDADADETVLNAILGDTTGIVTANLAGAAATLNTALTNGDANDALTITLDAGVAAATDLTGLAGKTSVNLIAGAVTGINGTAVQVKAVVDATDITTALNYTSTVSDADADETVLNAILGDTTGIVTANLTGAAATLNTALTNGDANDALTITLDAGVAAATVLTALDGKTSVNVGAGAITGINGTAAEVKAVVDAVGITTALNYTSTVSDADADETVLNAILGDTTGIVTANLTGVAATLNTALTNGDANDALTITLDAGVAAATVLTALDGKTSVNVGAGAITGINGTAAEVKAVVDAVGITTALNYTSTVSDADADETVLNAILGDTTGIVTANLAGAAATLNTALTNGDANDALTITLDAGVAAATDLTGLAGKTSVNLIAGAVTGINGTAVQVKAVVDATDITTALNYTSTVSDADADETVLNAILGDTTGIVTANLTGAAATLNTALTNGDANDALTITLDAGVAAATVLTALDGKTSVNVGAGAITGINGTAAEVKAVVDAVGITTALNYTSTVSDADADETVLNAILGDTTGIVTANLTGVAATLNTALTNGDANDALTITLDAGVAAATVLTALDGKTSVNVGAGAITGINGTAAEVKAVVDAVGITTALNYTSTVSDADADETVLNAILGDTTGIVTANLAGAAATLNTALTNGDANDALTITLTNVSTDIANIYALNNKTSVDVGAGAVGTITSVSTTNIDLTQTGITWKSGINVTGTVNNDTITATGGNDTITGGAGADNLQGGLGADVFVLNSSAADQTDTGEVINGGGGTDILVVAGGTTAVDLSDDTLTSIETLELTKQADNTSPDSNAQSLTMTRDQVAALTTINAAVTSIFSGGDTITLSNAMTSTMLDFVIVNGGVILKAANAASNALTLTQSTLGNTGALYLDASTLTGTNAFAFNGAAETSTGAKVVFLGGAAGDTFVGTSGDDAVRALGGADILTGGAGNDLFDFTGSDATIDTINDWGDGADTLSGQLAAGGQLNVIIADTSTTAFTAAVIASTNGVVSVTGGNADDSITGGAGNDTITGGAGDDTLVGGLGNDSITGGAGVDNLTGGTGADLFSLTGVNTAADRDTVTDFSVAQDKVGLDADFTLVGTAAGNAAAFATRTFLATNTGNNPATDYAVGLAGNAWDVIEFTGLDESRGNLGAATNGTELLNLFYTTSSSPQPPTSLQFSDYNANPSTSAVNTYLVAYDSGNAYVYLANSTDAWVQANEITLVGTFNGVGVGAFDVANFVMVA